MADGLSMIANTRCTAPEALLMSGKVTLACAMPIAASRIARNTCSSQNGDQVSTVNQFLSGKRSLLIWPSSKLPHVHCHSERGTPSSCQ